MWTTHNSPIIMSNDYPMLWTCSTLGLTISRSHPLYFIIYICPIKPPSIITPLHIQNMNMACICRYTSCAYIYIWYTHTNHTRTDKTHLPKVSTHPHSRPHSRCPDLPRRGICRAHHQGCCHRRRRWGGHLIFNLPQLAPRSVPGMAPGGGE